MGRRECREGLRIRGSRGRPEVRDAYVRFARWLRSRFEFPIRCPVYLSPRHRVRAVDGDEVVAQFFVPHDPREEPYIQAATGDYEELRCEHGKYDCLALFLETLAHEIAHYQQWLVHRYEWRRNRAKWLREVDAWEAAADEMAEDMVEAYLETVDHP